jgi:hypothetical protein
MQVTPYQNYQYAAPAGQVANTWGAGGQTQGQLSAYGQNTDKYGQNPYGQNPYGPGPFGPGPIWTKSMGATTTWLEP